MSGSKERPEPGGAEPGRTEPAEPAAEAAEGGGAAERTAAVLMICTAASRVLGYLRQALIAAAFGAGGQADVFHALFQVPNSMRRLLAEGAFSAALVPALARERTPQAQVELVRSAFALQLAVSVPVIGLAVLAAAPITRVLFAFPEPEQMAGAAGLFRVMMPYAALTGGAAVLMGGLHARGVFVVPALAPLLFSAGMIASILALARPLGIYAAGVGVIAGGLLQLLFQAPSFLRRGYRMAPRLRFDDRVRSIVRAWGPAVASALVFTVMQAVAYRLASGLADGSASALSNAVFFYQLPLGVLSVSVVTAAFPRLAALAAAGRQAELRQRTTDGLVTLAALLTPPAVAFLLLGGAVVHAGLQRGRFDAEATALTAAVLRGFALGLPSVGIFTFLQRLCYAVDEPGRALRAALAVGVIDVGLSLWWQRTLGVTGLAFANSAAFTAGALLLALPSRRVAWPQLGKGAAQVAAGTAPAAVLMWIVSLRLPAPAQGAATPLQTALLAGTAAAAAALTVVTYRLAGLPFVRKLTARRRGASAPS